MGSCMWNWEIAINGQHVINKNIFSYILSKKVNIQIIIPFTGQKRLGGPSETNRANLVIEKTEIIEIISNFRNLIMCFILFMFLQ